MPAHHWSSKIHSSSCSRCEAIRTRIPDSNGWSYRLPDGYGSLEKRPACTRPSESRRTRKMGRRSKVMARSRAGGKRLLSREEQVRRTANMTFSLDTDGTLVVQTTAATLSDMTLPVVAEETV